MTNQNLPFSYSVRKHKRARHITLSVHHDGRVTVTIPRWAPKRAAHAFVLEKHTWISKRIAQYEQEYPKVLQTTREDYEKFKEDARTLVHARLEHFNQYYRFPYKRVAIRDTRSRWGSCSSNGNLNFSYKVFFLPPELQDYIVVHELCHLKEMNHSRRFWDLVKEAIPNYRALRQELKKHELGL